MRQEHSARSKTDKMVTDFAGEILPMYDNCMARQSLFIIASSDNNRVAMGIVSLMQIATLVDNLRIENSANFVLSFISLFNEKTGDNYKETNYVYSLYF